MYLFGASGHAKVILEILEATNIKVEEFYDDYSSKTSLKRTRLLADTDDHDPLKTPFIVPMGEGTLTGTSAIIVPNVEISKWVVTEVGSVVINDIPDNWTVVGNPTRIVKQH